MRKKRHRIVYEEMDIVSEDEAGQALKWAEEFVNRISEIIQRKDPAHKNASPRFY